ncbi:MAG TPA: isoprenylcysteine carboxylmethyltransferase family protein [Bradyrhizobium sp.]|uniref:methyltransferase family protein n=1 Tax=Bradyrhizobium sp. TaxID=376 RepID=UPI002CF8E941|nr:isoprenylcysteine carboxylmethyltransferase family protein [Bradyrhizobium sp.]HLZ03510.1 isoprenylcysteine carboxylmethyltransferase family protein [Bradyrhizobium sp.]
MTIFQPIIPVLWLAFLVYWGVSALRAKRNVVATAWWRQGLLRVGVIVLTLAVFQIFGKGHGLRAVQAYQAHSMTLGAIGTALVLLGIALAVFARVTIGRNWGMPMSRKENPELVTGGPYAFVRHPIYTGIILAMLGSAIGQSFYWVLPLILFTPYFVYSARREEELMCELFPAQYPAYMRRTSMILPFVL